MLTFPSDLKTNESFFVGPWMSWGPWRCACWGPANGQDGRGHSAVHTGHEEGLVLRSWRPGGPGGVQARGRHGVLGTGLDVPMPPWEASARSCEAVHPRFAVGCHRWPQPLHPTWSPTHRTPGACRCPAIPGRQKCPLPSSTSCCFLLSIPRRPPRCGGCLWGAGRCSQGGLGSGWSCHWGGERRGAPVSLPGVPGSRGVGVGGCWFPSAIRLLEQEKLVSL